MMQICQSLSDRADRYRHISLAVETGPRDIDGEHEAIAKAALARDAVAAQRALAHALRADRALYLDAASAHRRVRAAALTPRSSAASPRG